MLRWWTIRRATGIGLTAGLAALILWPLYAAYPERAFWPFIVALWVTTANGLLILIVTAADMLTHGPRGERVRPIRAFDIAVGVTLTVPSLVEISALL